MNRCKHLLHAVRGCLVTNFFSLHFDGGNTDILYRGWYINNFSWLWWRFAQSKYYNSVSCNWCFDCMVLATLAAFWNRLLFNNSCLNFAFLTLPDLQNSPKTTPTFPSINPETIKKTTPNCLAIIILHKFFPYKQRYSKKANVTQFIHVLE